MIIQNYTAIDQPTRDQEELNKEIQEYKRINASLKKKIQARDRKITYLFSCIDQMSKSSIKQSQQTDTLQSLQRNSSQIQISGGIKHPNTEPRRKQKQNVSTNNYNIFKERSGMPEKFHLQENFKLPALQKKNIFIESTISIQNSDNPEVKPRIVRISKEKLVPIRSDEIKKKFQKKFTKQIPNIS